jgi:hypothetical protein
MSPLSLYVANVANVANVAIVAIVVIVVVVAMSASYVALYVSIACRRFMFCRR